MDFNTLCIHGSSKKYDLTGAISVPIFQSATFAHPAVGESTGFDYSRLQNPTREHLETVVANLEHGADAMAFSTGMAAIASIMELFSPGDHIIATDDLYGGSYRLFENISTKNGISIDYTDTFSESNLLKLIKRETRAIFIETPTNPMMHVVDIEEISNFCKQNNLLLIVDNTFLTPYFQKPILLGADIVVHSGTKYLGGHNDTLAGFVITAKQELADKLRFIYKTTGACLSPFDSWLLIRGIKTLAIRMECQQKNAQKIAEWLLTQKEIKAVHYPGLPDNPTYKVSQKQASGFGAMLSFEVFNKEAAAKLLQNVKIIQYAESLGGVESLITYPMMQTHADVPKDVRETKGINENLLRLSVGIEDAHDLIKDLEQALR